MEKHRLSFICYLSKTHFVRDFLQNSIGNSSTSTTCNPIYSEGTILELQITMEFHRQLIHQHHLQCHLHCGNDPRVANHNGIPSATHPPAPLAIPFYIAGTIVQLQITMEFCRPRMHEKQLKPHLQCGTDPNMIRACSGSSWLPSNHLYIYIYYLYIYIIYIYIYYLYIYIIYQRKLGSNTSVLRIF